MHHLCKNLLDEQTLRSLVEGNACLLVCVTVGFIRCTRDEVTKGQLDTGKYSVKSIKISHTLFGETAHG